MTHLRMEEIQLKLVFPEAYFVPVYTEGPSVPQKALEVKAEKWC